MKLLHYVSFWRKSIHLIGPSGENLEFPSPILAAEIVDRYPGYRLCDSSGVLVPSQSKLKAGTTYLLTLRVNGQADGRSFRNTSVRTTTPEYRRSRSTGMWHPSLSRISEDGTAMTPRRVKDRPVQKPVGRDRSRTGKRICVSQAESYRNAVPTALSFPVSFAPTPFLF